MNFRTAIRRTCSLLLGGVMAFTCAVSAVAIAFTDTGVRVRDPWVLEHEGTYYLYGTGLAWNGYGCVYSDDLTNWSDPVKVYEPEGACDGENDWWAPECHEYEGHFYLFATYRSAASGKRGVAIFRSADPLGPFEIITDGHITPKDRDAIDGTLYVDEDGQPHEVATFDDGLMFGGDTGTPVAKKLNEMWNGEFGEKWKVTRIAGKAQRRSDGICQRPDPAVPRHGPPLGQWRRH